jgi:DNA-binding response OmpR family regulator
MKILVVDDERSSQTLLRGLISKLGHDVQVAADGAEAWRVLGEVDFRLVVTDWNMPHMPGPELCRRIRERCGPYVYVIMVTARNDMESFSVGMAAGADDFITKPVDVALLAARVRVAERILSLQREVHELRAQQLPVCIYCKRLKVEGDPKRTGATDRWVSTAQYLADVPGVDLTERICPDCYARHLAAEVAKLDG